MSSTCRALAKATSRPLRYTVPWGMARTFRTAPPRKLDVVRPHSMVALGLVTMYLMQLLLMKLTGALQPSLADRRFPAAGDAAGVAAAAGAYRRGLAQEPPQPRQQAHAGPAAGATLSRAQQAMRLERLANSDPMLGICHEGGVVRVVRCGCGNGLDIWR